MSLLASGIDGTVMAACVFAAIFVADRFGRRHSLGIGAAIMAFSLMVRYHRHLEVSLDLVTNRVDIA